MTSLAEAADLRRLRHHRQLLKFCGMEHATMQSGMFRVQSRLVKELQAENRHPTNEEAALARYIGWRG